MNTLITIREASDLLGVSIKTLRRWEQQGKI
ncbi:MAG: MerR family DNA-binding transcriptional regulator, partial [Microcystis sp. M53599_WE4]|nr:MerR family DNA-binding transcriptional regulator [Microcystis sp. M53599_WE4]